MLRRLVFVLALLCSSSVAARTVLNVVPNTTAREAGEWHLADALTHLEPGMVLHLAPGGYDVADLSERLTITASGTPEQPIIIEGSGPGTIIRGAARGVAALALPHVPGQSAFIRPHYARTASCVRIDEQQWIVIRELSFESCAVAVHARNSRYLTLDGITATGGQYVMFAEGPQSHHLLLENSTWTQDPSEDMWQRKHWCAYKFGLERNMNGAMFGSQDIAGDVIIRRNHVHHAFNAVRVDVSRARQRDPHWRGRLNANFDIYGNVFEYIRDNVLEPEYDATNWWMYENRIHNAHAWFSFDGLHGGRWHLFNNMGGFDDKPSRRCLRHEGCRQWARERPDACGDLHSDGRVIKLRRDGQAAPGPLNVFNNSWYLRASITKRGRFGTWNHFNNAIEFCRSGAHADGICDRPRFFNGLKWDAARYRFMNDLSNHRNFPLELARRGFAVQGISTNGQAVFNRMANSRLELVDGSPGLGGAACQRLPSTARSVAQHARPGSPKFPGT